MSRAALVLSPNRAPETDGFLTVYEVSASDLWGTELVVLSACEIGRGKPDRARGVQGLHKAFFTAGARSLVMSLWSVDDRATSEFMQAFYQQLARGAGRVQALQSASKSVRDKHADPYFWAPFILLGDTGPLNLARASEGARVTTAGEDDESRLRRAFELKRRQHTITKLGTAEWTVDAKRDDVLDACVSRREDARSPMVLTLLGRRTSVSMRVDTFAGVGKYKVGSGMSATVGGVQDPLALDITSLHRDTTSTAAASGTLQVAADSAEAGFYGTFSLRLRDGRRVEGTFKLESGLPSLPEFMRKQPTAKP